MASAAYFQYATTSTSTTLARIGNIVPNGALVGRTYRLDGLMFSVETRVPNTTATSEWVVKVLYTDGRHITNPLPAPPPTVTTDWFGLTATNCALRRDGPNGRHWGSAFDVGQGILGSGEDRPFRRVWDLTRDPTVRDLPRTATFSGGAAVSGSFVADVWYLRVNSGAPTSSLIVEAVWTLLP